MRHTAQHDIGTTMNLMSEYQENPKMEALWKKTFSNEYKPDVLIDFQKIKDMLIERKIRTGRELPHYNYNLIHPITLCDIFITHPPKQWSVSFLESLPENTQRALADLLL